MHEINEITSISSLLFDERGAAARVQWQWQAAEAQVGAEGDLKAEGTEREEEQEDLLLARGSGQSLLQIRGSPNVVISFPGLRHRTASL